VFCRYVLQKLKYNNAPYTYKLLFYGTRKRLLAQIIQYSNFILYPYELLRRKYNMLLIPEKAIVYNLNSFLNEISYRSIGNIMHE